MPQLSFTDTPAIGLSGQIADARNYRSSSKINRADSGVVIRPGCFVVRASTVAGRESEVTPPAAATDITGAPAAGGGFAIFRDLHVNPTVVTNVDRAYYQPAETLPVMEQGAMFVFCETACTAGGKVFVRHTAKGGNTVLGTVRNDADPTAAPADTATALVNARFASTLAASGIAKIEFDVRPTG